MSILNNYIIDYSLVDKFGLDQLLDLAVLPLKKYDFYTLVAIGDDVDISYLESNFNTPLKTIKVNKNDILFHLNEFPQRYKIYDMVQNSIKSNLNQNHINLFFKYLLEFAISKDASDIHFETLEDALLIRYRVDGLLQQFFKFELDLYPIVSSVTNSDEWKIFKSH
jgi:type II secretory ATPase GspE/PulE/Tfp pilus assembly ATPase PilB-like protein